MSEKSLDRRMFLKASGATAGVAVLVKPGSATTAPGRPAADRALPWYEKKFIGNINQLTHTMPLIFSYPDASSPCIAVKLGIAAPNGVGPDQDIVAYSLMCAHMGCPVAFDAGTNTFKCVCHYSMFDAEKSGQMIAGQATENLPRIRLDCDEKTGQISAMGIDGMLYGRYKNIL